MNPSPLPASTAEVGARTGFALPAAMFLLSFALILFELALTRLFAIVLFATFAHLALALALLGISAGALLQHLFPSLVPDRDAERGLGWMAVGVAASSIGAMVLGVMLPVTRQFATPPEVFEERSSISWNLVQPGWFAALLLALVVPFAFAGLAFAAAFFRRKASIGRLYAADLLGGAFGALAFVPLLYHLSGPDAVFVVAAACCVAALALFRVCPDSLGVGLAWAMLVGCLGAALWAATGHELLTVRFAAGYSETNITYVKWTPLTRVAVHEDDKRGPYIVLDNTSASRVIRTDEDRASADEEANRSLVYRLDRELAARAAALPEEAREVTLARIGPPSAHVAILAASAGPEVAIAQGYGFTGIEAIDVAPEIGQVVADRFADAPANPYLHGDTQRVVLDGRAAILHAHQPYHIIQMVHANLHSAAGLLADAWSPALLETREAFALYLSRLEPDGMLSFGRGTRTPDDARAVAAALHLRGIPDPERYIAVVTGPATVMLVRPRPWTPEEAAALRDVVATYPGQEVQFDPVKHGKKQVDELLRGLVMTDDRPYSESPSYAWEMMCEAGRRFLGLEHGEVAPAAVVYQTLLLQILFVVAAGAALVGVPLARREPTGLAAISGVRWALAYVCCLGYGYLAVETVLIHHLVLFVGHPTYAITVVVLSMLLFSGLGSAWVGRMSDQRVATVLPLGIGAVFLLGLALGWEVAPGLQDWAFGYPIPVRMAIAFAAVAPLGFAMGIPFPAGIRLLRPDVAAVIPWAWALNGYLSVVASLVTVLVSRIFGYQAAYGVAMAAYLAALPLAARLPSVAPRGA